VQDIIKQPNRAAYIIHNRTPTRYWPMNAQITAQLVLIATHNTKIVS